MYLVLSILMKHRALYLCALGFLFLEGDNLYNPFPDVGFEIGGKQCFVVMVALIILPSLWLDSLSLLSCISAGGVFAPVVILGSVSWTGALDYGIGFHQQGRLLNWSGVPTAVSFECFLLLGSSSVYNPLHFHGKQTSLPKCKQLYI